MRNFKLSLIAGIVCCLTDQLTYAQSGSPGFIVEAIGSQVIPLTINKMTNIIFPTVIKPGIKVSRDIMAERPKGTTNVLVLKAGRRGFAPTNLSVYGIDGSLYSFELRYVENPADLNFRISGAGVAIELPLEKAAEAIRKKQAFMDHLGTMEKMQLILKGIYLQDGFMWFSLSIRNHSAIGYTPEGMRWVVRDERRLRRTAVQEIILAPEYASPVSYVPGDSSRAIVVGFRPFALAKDKVLVMQVEEKDGGRMLALKIGHNLLLKARSLKNER